MTRTQLSLSFSQKVNRIYGIWWDIINTSVVVLILAFGFIALSVIIIMGRVDLLPFQETMWKQFIETVPPQKQSELGLGLFSISVSASSAAALYLIRIGTKRWANNRRIGFIHGYFAEAMLSRCLEDDCESERMRAVLVAFLDSSMKVFEQISETHPRAQFFFEQARMKSHIYLQDGEARQDGVRDISVDLFAAALICKKSVLISERQSVVELDVKKRLSEQ